MRLERVVVGQPDVFEIDKRGRWAGVFGGGHGKSEKRPAPARGAGLGRLGACAGLLLQRRQHVEHRGTRQHRAVPDRLGVDAALGAVGVGHLRRHQRQASGHDLAEAFLARVGAGHHRVDGQLEAARLQCHVDDAVARLHRLDGGRRVGHHLLGAFGERAQKGLDRGRVLLDQLGAGDDGVAVQLHPKVGEGHHHHVFGFGAARLQVQERGEAETGDGVDVATHQHGLAQGRVHRGPADVADVVGFLEQRERLAPGVVHRRAELLAAQVGGLGDAAF